jgi:hypothetical protein
MSVVHWIKTGKRGARAEFTDSDLITALLILHDKQMGRYQLQKMLALSDSSTKSLLNYSKKLELVETAGQQGHKLTAKGIQIIEMVKQVILDHNICEYKFFPNLKHYFLIISPMDNEIYSSWKFRDVAIAYGADSILFLNYIEDILLFPEEEMNLDDYYPDFKDFFTAEIAFKSLSNYHLLIVAAQSTASARKCSIITALHSNQQILSELHKKLECDV